jgi:acyl-CoA reductase-like NAD-dependent aldehyde dehydrogenase
MTRNARQNFIGGGWQDARSDRTDEVIDPATGEVIADVASSNEADVDAAVTAAAEAFDEWAATAPGERAKALQQLADRLEEHADELVEIESRNVGKPIAAVPDEIAFLADTFVLRSGCSQPHHASPGEYLAGYTSILRATPRCRGVDRALELR